MAFSYYIYYRVAQPEKAAVAVHRLQSALLEHCGVSGRVLKKRDEPLLWMETYEGVPDGAAFEARLAELVEDTNFNQVLAAGGERRIECFEER